MMITKYIFTTSLIFAGLLVGASATKAQTTSNSTQSAPIGNNSNGNTSVQTNPQNSQNNSQQINYPSIPLSPVIQNPVNTENDFGLNLGAALNTIDGRNTTIYLGITFQPGRTDDHNARMAKLRSETQILESQKQITQTQLQLLKQQVTEQELRLQRMRSREQTPTK